MALQNIKAFILVVCILASIVLHPASAKAAESETLVVAGGCFWCVESDFETVPGVTEVISGYTGGAAANPTYKSVTSGRSGHYEAVQIIFDPGRVSRKDLLHMFLRSVDPTDDGGQFCDRGSSYRTAIFVSNTGEQTLAEKEVQRAASDLGQTVVTPILTEGPFYPAEDYHQDYYKGQKLVFTRAGPKRQSTAYKFYRKGCGRDKRVLALWGDAAPFAKLH
jgi:peptide-methionine (S)-S-oxide reductase